MPESTPLQRVPDTSPAFFEAMYRDSEDPWGFALAAAEQARYDAMLAALGGRQFRRAFEPACAIGEFTRRLAGCCDRVDALDASATAARTAARRCAGLSNVSVTTGVLPDDLPDVPFDLIVLAECGYYFDEPDLRLLVHALAHRLEPGGVLLACHWLGTSTDHVLPGARVNDIIAGSAHWTSAHGVVFEVTNHVLHSFVRADSTGG